MFIQGVGRIVDMDYFYPINRVMKNKRVIPPFLCSGDEVAIISPSWSISGERIALAADILEKWGLKVRIGGNALKQHGPFAGSDSERMRDLQEMTDDPAIKAVICSRGGYGMLRIINGIDFGQTGQNNLRLQRYVLHLWRPGIHASITAICHLTSDRGKKRKRP